MGARMAQMLVDILNIAVTRACCPSDGQKGSIAPLYKERDLELAGNYRGGGGGGSCIRILLA